MVVTIELLIEGEEKAQVGLLSVTVKFQTIREEPLLLTNRVSLPERIKKPDKSGAREPQKPRQKVYSICRRGAFPI